MKNRFKLGSLLILVVLLTVSCQKENVLQENEINPTQAESKSRLKTTEEFEFAIELFTQDEPDGPVVPASGSITIESDSSTIYTGQLVEGGNRIYTSNEVNYTIIIEKEGYVTYEQDFTYAELEVHKIQRYTVPLEVVLEKENGVIINAEIVEQGWLQLSFGNENGLVFSIDWGDGSEIEDIEIVSYSFHITHNYTSLGNYTIRITGDIDRLTGFSGHLDWQYNPNAIKIHEINISEAVNLEQFVWTGGNLPAIDLSQNTILKALNLHNTQINSLDLSQHTSLINLEISDNQLTNLDVSNNLLLESLGCSENQLISLDLSNNSNLIGLSCGKNQLSSLDLSNNILLEILHCNNCPNLSSLDLSFNTAITLVSCINSQLANLNLKNGNNLILERLYATGNPNLTICVDDVTYANNQPNWAKDVTAIYSTCE